MGGGWTDLGVRADPDNPLALREHLATAVALGYATVATDTRVDAGDKAAGREIARGLDPIDPAALASALADASARGARPVLNRLTRLTIRFGEPGELQALLNAHDRLVRAYDILALEPTTERALASACANRRCDVIALALGARPSFRLRAGAVRAAASNGIAFEVAYVWALMDTTARRNFFANAAALVRACGGGGDAGATDGVGGVVVLTGGSRRANEMRAPLDVVNLATMFGMRDRDARRALATRCDSIAARAAERRRRLAAEASDAA